MLKLLERKRTVVERRGHAESVFHQRLLARAVAVIHAVQLRHSLVRLVDEHQKIARKIIQQSRRRLARKPSREMPRVIFDAMAVAHGLDHFQVVHHALVDALRLHQPSLLFQFRFPPGQFFLDRSHGRSPRFFFHHIVRLGINRQPHVTLLDRPEQRIDLRQRFDLIAKHFHAIGIVIVGGINFDDIPAHPKRPAPKIPFRALVKCRPACA
jgi:hypothetical protein